MRRILFLLLALAVAACTAQPEPAQPAFWRVDGPKGERFWLLGTIHALEKPALWRSPAIDQALKEADRVVVEVRAVTDPAAMTRIFAELGRTDGMPPLSQRVAADQRPALAALLRRKNFNESQFANTETWAAALTLARAGAERANSANGVDRAVIEAAGGKPVVELEGAHAQLQIFDRLPESEQRDLLAAVVRDVPAEDEDPSLAQAWRKGDMATIARETHGGLLADPELREALLVARNQRWLASVTAMAMAGHKPFVAVGAAHLAGPEGLPALLAASGFTVTRVQ